jgi:hypothetical protein
MLYYNLILAVFGHQAGQDEPELFWPVICAVVNDNPEGHRLTGVYGSAKAQFPCRMCLSVKLEIDNVFL